MTKTTKRLIGLVAIVAVTGLLLLALNLLNKPGEEEAPVTDTPLAEVIYVLGGKEVNKVKSVEVKNDKNTFTVVIEDPEASSADAVYYIDGYKGLPAQKAKTGSIITNTAKLIAKSLVAEGNESFAAYGLDKPTVTASISLADGTKQKLLIGNAAPGSEGYYVTAKGDNVYLVSSNYVENFFLTPFDFMDNTITTSTGDPQSDTFGDVTLDGAFRDEPIIIRESAEGTDHEAEFSTHRITSPISVDLDTQKGSEIIRSVFGLKATEIVDVAETEAVLAKYGLDEPYSTAQVKSPEEVGGNFTLKASAPDSEGMVYLTTTKSKLVYRYPAKDLLWLEANVHDLMAKLAILPHIDKVSKVTVKSPSQSYVFECSGEGEDLIAYCNGTALNTSDYRKFYQSLLSASFDEIPTEPLSESDLPSYTFTYEYRDGSKPDVVSFYTGSARRLYIRLNDGTAFYTKSTYMDKILEDIPKLLAGEAVTAYI